MKRFKLHNIDWLVVALLGLLIVAVSGVAIAQDAGAQKSAKTSKAEKPKQQDTDSDALEGDQRFRTNCARCHASPHKLSPRMMATVIRHMRVRATLTDEDTRLILAYMTK